MFFNSKTFKTVEAGVQLSWLQQQLHLQNISKIETPGYKTKSLVFDDALNKAMATGKGPDVVSAKVITEEATSLLQDGNNVDVEKENIEMYKAYSQYSLLLDKVKGQFDNYNLVLNSNMK